MKSIWSSSSAKKQLATREKSLRPFHPQTRSALKIIFAMIQEGQRVSYHGFPYAVHQTVARELRSLGYEVINHNTFAGIDLIKYEVRVV